MRRPANLVTLALLALAGAVGLAQRPGAGEAARTAGPASAAFGVSGAAPAAPVDFDNDLIPVFTTAGCNSGACHGSAGRPGRPQALALRRRPARRLRGDRAPVERTPRQPVAAGA